MKCIWFEGKFLGFLQRSVSAMGCFFGCFRIKDDHRPRTNLVSEKTAPSKAAEPVVSRNKLASLLLSEEKDDSPNMDKENHILGTPLPRIDVRGLKDEAKFLKACGTIPETPAEIRKASEKLKDLSPHSADSDYKKFHSWLPNTSIQKLNLYMQTDQPHTPIQLCEEWVKGSGSAVDTPSSCITNGQNIGMISSCSTEDSGVGNVSTATKVQANQTYKYTAPSDSPSPLGASVQCRNKSVRFDCESDVTSFPSGSSSCEIASQNPKQSQSAGNYSVSKPSPYPTPLKLTDEMQTPGTVFPAYLENMANGKNPRIRSQYVYSVLNPVENSAQWKELKEDESNSNQLSGPLRESLEQAAKARPTPEVGTREPSVEEEMKVEASLSSWLKPPPINLDGNTISSENARVGRTPADRPIIGMVAAHWNENEPSHISPKWWDGNGIPNSTNKYKEDQKVSWHATPFEERLEKALSEETSISQRKHISGTPQIDFDENEECDTALSQLQSSTHFKSVVSC